MTTGRNIQRQLILLFALAVAAALCCVWLALSKTGGSRSNEVPARRNSSHRAKHANRIDGFTGSVHYSAGAITNTQPLPWSPTNPYGHVYMHDNLHDGSWVVAASNAGAKSRAAPSGR